MATTNSTDLDPLYSENEMHHEVDVFELMSLLSVHSKVMLVVTVKTLIDLFELHFSVVKYCITGTIEAAFHLCAF